MPEVGRFLPRLPRKSWMLFRLPPDFPFSDRYSDAAVFRHPDNRKWYAIVMGIGRSKLPPKPAGCGPDGLGALAPDAAIDVMNLKANPAEIPALVREPGIFPCYHMNRKHWVSVALEDILPDERVMLLVEASREATRPRGGAISTLHSPHSTPATRRRNP